MQSTGSGVGGRTGRRLMCLADSIQRHERAIAAERRAVIVATARIAEWKARVKRLRELESKIKGQSGHDEVSGSAACVGTRVAEGPVAAPH